MYNNKICFEPVLMVPFALTSKNLPPHLPTPKFLALPSLASHHTHEIKKNAYHFPFPFQKEYPQSSVSPASGLKGFLICSGYSICPDLDRDLTAICLELAFYTDQPTAPDPLPSV